MWLPWTRRRRPTELTPGQRWPDGDTVLLHPEGRRSADILRELLGEPTQQLPTVRPPTTPAPQLATEPPLMTLSAQWRANGGAW